MAFLLQFLSNNLIRTATLHVLIYLLLDLNILIKCYQFLKSYVKQPEMFYTKCSFILFITLLTQSFTFADAVDALRKFVIEYFFNLLFKIDMRKHRHKLVRFSLFYL